MVRNAHTRRLILCVAVCVASVAECAAHGDIQLRLDMATRTIETQPEAPIHYLKRADLYREHRDWVAAEEDIARARSIDQADPDIAYYEALLQRDRGELDRAVLGLRVFLEQSRIDAEAQTPRAKAHADLARVLGMLGDWHGAGEHFSLAIEHSDSPGPQLYLDRAEALRNAGGAEWVHEALRGLDEGISRLGTPGVLQNRAIEIQLETRDYDAALVRIEGRMSVPGYRLPELVRKAEVLEQAGRQDAAADAYAQAQDAIRALPAKVRSTYAVEILSARVESGLSRVRSGAVPQGAVLPKMP